MEVDEPEKNDDDLCLRNIMLDDISLNVEAHFRSQQLNEPDLTTREKRQIAEDVLMKSPGSFLARFGKYLKEKHLDYFTSLASVDYEVNYYITTLRKGFNQTNTKSVIRNRRLEALRRLTEQGQYFSDDEMRKRNPLMYENLVGQYLTAEEKQQSLSDRLNESQGFTNFLLNAIDEKEISEKLQNETEKEEESDCDSDESSEQAINPVDKESLWGECYTFKKDEKYRRPKKPVKPEPLSEEEKSRLLNEFRSRMYSDFLGGKDNDFDYR